MKKRNESMRWMIGALILAAAMAEGIGGCTTTSQAHPTKAPSPTPTTVPCLQATLYIYVCPQFFTDGSCTSTLYINVGGVCVGPLTSGGWWDMGVTVNAGTSYAIQGFNNASCTTGAGAPGTLTTPSSFPPNCRYCWTDIWRCVNTCSQTACP